MEDEEQTLALWKSIPGGQAIVAWMGGKVPDFGDGKVVRLHLNRKEPSILELEMNHLGEARLVFTLSDWIDVSIQGFSHQNVVSNLTITLAADSEIAPWEKGVGLKPGKCEIELEPCFGANGRIRATVSKIELRKA